MTRFINTALIVLVAFVVILSLLWLVVDPKAPGLVATDGDAPATAITVRSTDATWAGDVDGERLQVELLLRNTGAAGSLTQLAYRATVNGQVVSATTEDPPLSVPAGMDVPVAFTVALPPDFAARWFDAYQDDAETVTLRVDGTLTVRTATLDQRIPFEWSSTWQGRLLERLAAGAQECPGPPAPLCLHDLDAGFADGGLRVRLGLRNDQADPLVVRNGTFRLQLEDGTVAIGRLEGALEIAAGDDRDIPVTLAFDDAALDAWWGGHVQRCESSRLALSVALEVESVGSGASLVDWSVLAAPFATGFACEGPR